MSITPVNLTDTFDIWRTRTNQIINLTSSTESNVANVSAATVAAFDKANTAGGGFYRGNNGDKGLVTNKNDIFRINTTNVTSNITFSAFENASATGPLYLANNVTLTIQENARVVIL